MAELQEELWDGNVTMRVGSDGEPFTLPVWETQIDLEQIYNEHEGKPLNEYLQAVINYVAERTGQTISMGTALSLRETIGNCLTGKKKSPNGTTASTPNSASSTASPPLD